MGIGRIRTIKPEHWNDKELPNISIPAHLLWIGIWNFSDDMGIIEDDEVLIKSQVFPRRTNIRTGDVIKWLRELVNARFLIPFEFENEGYYLTRTFKAHQRIDKPQPSKIPKEVLIKLFTNSANAEGLFSDSSLLYSNGKDSKVKVEVPMAFDSEIFKEKWVEWEIFRKEKKQKLTPTSIKKQMNLLRAYPEGIALQILETSMEKGWTGLFPPKENGTGAHQQSSFVSHPKQGTSQARNEAARKW